MLDMFVTDAVLNCETFTKFRHALNILSVAVTEVILSEITTFFNATKTKNKLENDVIAPSWFSFTCSKYLWITEVTPEIVSDVIVDAAKARSSHPVE